MKTINNYVINFLLALKEIYNTKRICCNTNKCIPSNAGET